MCFLLCCVSNDRECKRKDGLIRKVSQQPCHFMLRKTPTINSEEASQEQSWQQRLVLRCQHARHAVKTLIYSNSALADQNQEVQDIITQLEIEKRFLLKRLLHYENIILSGESSSEEEIEQGKRHRNAV